MLQTYAMQQVLAKFGILQVARTGKISLKRGEELLEMGGWGDGRRKPQAQKAATEQPGNAASTSQNNGAVLEEQQQGGSDVYAVDNKQTGQSHCLPASALQALLHQPGIGVHIVIRLAFCQGKTSRVNFCSGAS